MKVKVHLLSQSNPVTMINVINAYQKGSLYCVMTKTNKVYKFPLENIFRITEEYDEKKS